MPQGLKPLCVSGVERPKAEALGYLEAKTALVPYAESFAATAIVFDRKKADFGMRDFLSR